VVVEEPNSIGTTYLKAQLLPEPQRSRILALLRESVDVRRQSAELLNGSPEYNKLAIRSHELQAQMWSQTVEVAQSSPNILLSLFATSLTATVTLADKRLAAVINRIPVSVWLMSLLIALLTSFATGYSARRRVWLALLPTPIRVSIVMGLTADLDSPRSGFIRTDVRSLERIERQINSPGALPVVSQSQPVNQGSRKGQNYKYVEQS
jgi:hypothetical protein